MLGRPPISLTFLSFFLPFCSVTFLRSHFYPLGGTVIFFFVVFLCFSSPRIRCAGDLYGNTSLRGPSVESEPCYKEHYLVTPRSSMECVCHLSGFFVRPWGIYFVYSLSTTSPASSQLFTIHSAIISSCIMKKELGLNLLHNGINSSPDREKKERRKNVAMLAGARN